MESQNLRPGLIVAVPIKQGSQEAPLVTAGTVLTQRMIEILRRLGIADAWIHWPGLEALDGAAACRLHDVRQAVQQKLADDFTGRRDQHVDVSQYVRYCERIYDLVVEIVAAGRNGLGIPTLPLSQDPGLPAHMANVACLAVGLGVRMETYVTHQRTSAGATGAQELTNLGVGAMLHDIGKMQLPSTLKQHEPHLAAPGRTYKEHPRRGWQMIADRISATARSVVMHHHQRFDGTGFPDMASITRQRRSGPLAGCAIHVFSRIVGLCDCFDHLRRDEAGATRPVVAALAELAGNDLDGRFDPVLQFGLLQHVPPFPVGASLRLSNGAAAVVVRLNPNQPCRPTVRLLTEDAAQGGPVDLAREQTLHVKELLGVNVEKWLFEMPTPPKIPDTPPPTPATTPTPANVS